MTCEDRWKIIEPGAVVEFKSGQRAVKLADQWDRYTGINDYCCVGLNERDSKFNGVILHVSHFCALHATYKDQFKIVFV